MAELIVFLEITQLLLMICLSSSGIYVLMNKDKNKKPD
jgi:hypothetical protein